MKKYVVNPITGKLDIVEDATGDNNIDGGSPTTNYVTGQSVDGGSP